MYKEKILPIILKIVMFFPLSLIMNMRFLYISLLIRKSTVCRMLNIVSGVFKFLVFPEITVCRLFLFINDRLVVLFMKLSKEG